MLKPVRTASLMLACVIAFPVAATAVDDLGQSPSVMNYEWEKHLDLPWDFDPPIPFDPGGEPDNDGDLIVFGYLPYWKVGDVTLQLKLLSHLAYFGVGINGDGSLGDTRHWGLDAMDEITAAAHAEGVKVVLVVTAFSATVIETLLLSPANRQAAIDNLVDQVVSAGGDGVNVDFEGLPFSVKAQFVQFVADLKVAMDAAIGDSSVTLAMPAVDWKSAYDYDALAAACDGLFLMEYDFHYAGGDPGPVSPLAGSTPWGKYSVTWSLDDYDTWGGVSNRHKFILGMPLYGYDWPATYSEPPSTATADATSVTWAVCQSFGASLGWHWDYDSSTPWYDYYSGDQYHQVWCENPESLPMRMALARERGLGGVGFWALGYEGDNPEPWQAIVSLWELDRVEGEDAVAMAETVEAAPDSAYPPEAFDASTSDVEIVDTISDTSEPIDAGGDSGVIADMAVQRDIAVPDGTMVADTLDAAADSGQGADSAGHAGSSCSASAGAGGGVPVLIVLAVVLLFLYSNPILCRLGGRRRVARPR